LKLETLSGFPIHVLKHTDAASIVTYLMYPREPNDLLLPTDGNDAMLSINDYLTISDSNTDTMKLLARVTSSVSASNGRVYFLKVESDYNDGAYEKYRM
jgi:hypothetical protein